MIRRPGHLANGSAVGDVAGALARVQQSSAPDGRGPDGSGPGAPLDLALAAANVERAGGDPARFAASLEAGVRVATDTSGPVRPARLLDLVALAGWRSGVLRLRDDALARLDGLRRGTGGVGAAEVGAADVRAAEVGAAEARAAEAVAAAVLGIEASELDEFADRQRGDRFWWPGRARQRGYVVAVGGFTGLGGAWDGPPVDWRALDAPGAFAVLAGGDWWRLDADVWGSALVRLAGEPEASVAVDPNVQIVCRPDSYLAWIHVRDAA